MDGETEAVYNSRLQSYFSLFKITVGLGIFLLSPLMATIGYIPSIILLTACCLLTWESTAMLIRAHVAFPKAGGGEDAVVEFRGSMLGMGARSRLASRARSSYAAARNSLGYGFAGRKSTMAERVTMVIAPVIPLRCSVAVTELNDTTGRVETVVVYEPGMPSLVGRTLGPMFRKTAMVGLFLSCAYNNLLYFLLAGRYATEIFGGGEFTFGVSLCVLAFGLQLPGMLLSGKMRLLTYIAAFGVILWLVAGVGALVLGIRRLSEGSTATGVVAAKANSFFDFVGFFSGAMFAYSNNKVMIQMHDTIDPRYRGQKFNLFYIPVIGSFLLLFIFYSLLSYVAYGNELLGANSQLDILPTDGIGILFRVLLATSLQLSGPIYFVPLCEIIDSLAGVVTFTPRAGALDYEDEVPFDWWDFSIGLACRFLTLVAMVFFLVAVGSDNAKPVLTVGTATIVNYCAVILPALLELYNENANSYGLLRSSRDGSIAAGQPSKAAASSHADQPLLATSSSNKSEEGVNIDTKTESGTRGGNNLSSPTKNDQPKSRNKSRTNTADDMCISTSDQSQPIAEIRQPVKDTAAATKNRALSYGGTTGEGEKQSSQGVTPTPGPLGPKVLLNRPRTFRAWRAVLLLLVGSFVAISQLLALFVK